MNKYLLKFYILLATFFGVGNVKFAQGTFASLVTVFLWLLINALFKSFNFSFLSILIFWSLFIAIIFLVGIKASEIYSQEINNPDPKQVVIDEVAGQLLALLIGYFFAVLILKNDNNSSDLIIYLHLISSFIFFRFFDIIKPFFIGWLDKNIHGGLGIMLDDIAAGILGGIFSALLLVTFSYLLIF